MAVTLYRRVGRGRARRHQRVNLGPGRRPTNPSGPYFLRYSLADGTRPWEPVGDDLEAFIAATLFTLLLPFDNSPVALRKFRSARSRPDLLLLDLQMPDIQVLDEGVIEVASFSAH